MTELLLAIVVDVGAFHSIGVETSKQDLVENSVGARVLTYVIAPLYEVRIHSRRMRSNYYYYQNENNSK